MGRIYVAKEGINAQLSVPAENFNAFKEKLDEMLKREERTALHEATCHFLPIRAYLDLEGWDNEDIFAHS